MVVGLEETEQHWCERKFMDVYTTTLKHPIFPKSQFYNLFGDAGFLVGKAEL